MSFYGNLDNNLYPNIALNEQTKNNDKNLGIKDFKNICSYCHKEYNKIYRYIGLKPVELKYYEEDSKSVGFKTLNCSIGGYMENDDDLEHSIENDKISKEKLNRAYKELSELKKECEKRTRVHNSKFKSIKMDFYVDDYRGYQFIFTLEYIDKNQDNNAKM